MSPSSFATANTEPIVNQFVFNPNYEHFSAITSKFGLFNLVNENEHINHTNFNTARFHRVEDDLFSSSNSDEITCPQCFTPQSVFCVVEDAKQEQSKKFYICMSHNNEGCGWQGDEKPIEDDTKQRLKEKCG
ncbi:19500_t:CDS:1, partial [Racocetra persica]